MAQSVHENVKSVLFYLDTRVRTGGTIGSPTFTFPNNLIDIRPQKGEQVRLTMQEASIEYTFYQTELFNNKFLVREQTSDTGGEYVNRIVELDIGNYNLNTLIVELTNKLNIAASLYVYLISYIPKTNRLRFIATPKVGTSVSVIFDFNVESVQTIIGVFLGESANEILGFAIGATIVLTDTNFSGNLICESQIPITMSPGVQNLLASLPDSAHDAKYDTLHRGQRAIRQLDHDGLLKRSGGRENPYVIHQELGDVMTKAATVVRDNSQLTAALETVNELAERVKKCSLSDTGNWTNQNVIFTKSLRDMFPLAKALVKGALARDECRGAHFKPEFVMPGVDAEDPAEKRRQAESWCDAFEAKNNKWLKSTIATFDKAGEPSLSYEDVDTSLIPPRPRLYGLVGAELIEEVWKERQASSRGELPTGVPTAVSAS